MARQGFKVMDSDIHVKEPHDLWAKYIEPRFKDRAPQFSDIPDGSSPGVWRFEDKVLPAYIEMFLQLEGISDTSKRKILWDNCARLYHVQ